MIFAYNGELCHAQTTSIYYLIAGSYNTETDAHSAVEKLKSQGYSNAAVVGKNDYGSYRICYSSYSDKTTATAELNSMKSKGFTDTWILSVINTGDNSIAGRSVETDITSYEIKIYFDPKEKDITLSAEILLDNTSSTGSLNFLFTTLAKIKSLKSGDSKIDYSRKTKSSDTLQINIPEALKNNKKLNLVFDYSIPADSVLHDISYDSSKIKVCKHYDVILLGDRYWYPFMYNDVAGVETEVSAPTGYYVIAAGDYFGKEITNGKNNFKFSNSASISNAVIIAKSDKFSHYTKTIDSTKIHFYFATADATTIKDIIAEVSSSFFFYTNYFGSFKHKELSFFEVPDYDMRQVESYSALIPYGSPFTTFYKLNYGNWPVYETAKQWWGNNVFINSETTCSNFLECSMNEYFKILYEADDAVSDSLEQKLKARLNNYNKIDKTRELAFTEMKLLKYTEEEKSLMELSKVLCSEEEMTVFDRFLHVKHDSIFDKWNPNGKDDGIGPWEEYLDKVEADMIITYFSNKPENTEYRESGCSLFTSYCNGSLLDNTGGNRKPETKKYVDETYTIKDIIAISCKTDGLEADLIACITADRKCNCDKTFFAQNNYLQRQADGLVIFQKGPMVVNKLKNLMGEDIFKKFIKEVYSTYYGKLLLYDDFITVLSKYDGSGKAISSLHKWLSEKGWEE